MNKLTEIYTLRFSKKQAESLEKLKEYDMNLQLSDLEFIINPNYWLMENEFHEDFDKFFNNLMDNNHFILKADGFVDIGNFTFEHYETTFSLYKNDTRLPYRASRRTIQRAKKKLKIDIRENLEFERFSNLPF